MPVPLTLRSVKTTNLTAPEVDANFVNMKAIVDANEATILARDGSAGIAIYIPVLTVKDYKVAVKMPHGGTLTSITTICESGTATLGVKINGTAVTSTLNAVSAAETTEIPTAANVWAAGDDLVLACSVNAAALGVSVMLKYTRAN